MYQIKPNSSLEHHKIKLLEQSSYYLNKNYREVDIANLVRRYRKNASDITQYWVWLPPEFTSISQFIPLITLGLI